MEWPYAAAPFATKSRRQFAMERKFDELVSRKTSVDGLRLVGGGAVEVLAQDDGEQDKDEDDVGRDSAAEQLHEAWPSCAAAFRLSSVQCGDVDHHYNVQISPTATTNFDRQLCLHEKR